MSCPLVITSTPLFARQTAVITVSISSGSITSGLITAPVPTSPGQADSRLADCTQRNRSSPLIGTSPPRIAPGELSNQGEIQSVRDRAFDVSHQMLATRTKPATAPGDLRPRDDRVAVPECYGDDPATPESAVPGVATPD